MDQPIVGLVYYFDRVFSGSTLAPQRACPDAKRAGNVKLCTSQHLYHSESRLLQGGFQPGDESVDERLVTSGYVMKPVQEQADLPRTGLIKQSSLYLN